MERKTPSFRERFFRRSFMGRWWPPFALGQGVPARWDMPLAPLESPSPWDFIASEELLNPFLAPLGTFTSFTYRNVVDGLPLLIEVYH